MLLKQLHTPNDLKEAIIDVLKEDPRSNYRKDKCSDRLYYFTVDCVKITCWFDEEKNKDEICDIIAEVLKIEKLEK